MKVSWLPAHIIQTGQVGLTHSPGAHHDSRDDDLAYLAGEGVNRIVCLQQPFELSYTGPADETLEDRAEAVERFKMRFTHFPIPDFGTPRVADTARLIKKIAADVERERRIIIHCFAGLGRAGTIAACLLASRGFAPADAIEQVRSVRQGAVQTDEQEAFVARFAAALADPPDG